MFACFIVSTLSKLLPLLIFYQFLDLNIWWVVLGSVLVGSFWGLNFSDIRQVLGCSSILSIRWVLGFLIVGDFNIILVSFFLYFFFMAGVFFFSSLVTIVGSSEDKVCFSFFLFGLIGLPCFIVFYIKFFLVMSLYSYYKVLLMYVAGYGGVIIYIRMFYLNWVNRGTSLVFSYNAKEILVYFILIGLFFLWFFIFV